MNIGSINLLSNGIWHGTLQYDYTEDIIIKVNDDYGRVTYSDVITVRAEESKLYYRASLSQNPLIAGEPFSIDVELYDGNTDHLVTNDIRTVKAIVYPSKSGSEPGYDDAPLKTMGYIMNGKTTLVFSGYSKLETINIKLWDENEKFEPKYFENININPGPPNNLTIECKDSLEAGETGTITITVFDKCKNPIPDENVFVSILKGNASISSNILKTDQNGQSEVSLTPYKKLKATSNIFVQVKAGNVTRQKGIVVYGIPDTKIDMKAGLHIEKDNCIYAKPDTLISLDLTEKCKINGDVVIYYRIDNGEEKIYTGPFNISEVGKHTVEYYAKVTSKTTEITHIEDIKRSKVIYISATEKGKIVNYPNPFGSPDRTSTFIEYTLKQPSNVTITIYNLLGETVWQKEFMAGENGGKTELNTIEWDGKNNNGKTVGNGGYICRVWIENEKRALYRKIAIVK